MNPISLKKIGLNVGGLPARSCAKLAQSAEAKGLHSIWTYEILGRDAFTVLASMALATERIQLATGLINLFIRTPTLTAMSALSIDEISHGRMNLGLGVSYATALSRRHSITAEKPFTHLKEYIEIIRGIASEEKFNYQGKIFQYKNFKLGYKPVRSRVPIIIGAHNPKMLEFAGEVADGVLLNGITIGEVPFFLNHIEIGAKRAGRKLEDIEVASFFNCCADESSEGRMKELRKRIGWFLVMPHILNRLKRTGFRSEAIQAEEMIKSGKEDNITDVATDAMLKELFVADPPNKILQRIEEFRAAGITLPVLFPTPIRDDMQKGCEEILKLF